MSFPSLTNNKNNSSEPISKIVDYPSKSSQHRSEAWKSKYEELNGKHAELTKNYELLEEADKVKKITIDMMNKDIEEAKSNCSLVSKKVTELEEILVAKEKEFEEKLAAKEKELETAKAVKELDLTSVFKPTKKDLSNKLEGLEPLLVKVAKLHEDITAVRISVHTTNELIKYSQANELNLKESLDKNEPTYDLLVIEYLKLIPTIETALAELDALNTEALKHKDVSIEAVRCMSAMNDLPITIATANEKAFKELRTKCVNTYNKLQKDLKHVIKQYDETTWYLNRIDNYHDWYKQNVNYRTEPKYKVRISPTNSGFVAENVNITQESKTNENQIK